MVSPRFAGTSLRTSYFDLRSMIPQSNWRRSRGLQRRAWCLSAWAHNRVWKPRLLSFSSSTWPVASPQVLHTSMWIATSRGTGIIALAGHPGGPSCRSCLAAQTQWLTLPSFGSFTGIQQCQIHLRSTQQNASKRCKWRGHHRALAWAAGSLYQKTHATASAAQASHGFSTWLCGAATQTSPYTPSCCTAISSLLRGQTHSIQVHPSTLLFLMDLLLSAGCSSTSLHGFDLSEGP